MLRAFTVFLAALLFWSAMTTQERMFAAPAEDRPAVATLVADRSGAAGSVDHHHLDDQPGQLAEQAADLPAWFPATLRTASAAAPRLRLAAAAQAGPPTGTSSVLLRPPRA